jgi:hypothetical protein
VVTIPVAIAVLPDNDGLVAIPTIAVTVVFAIAVPIPFVDRTHRDAAGTDADPNLFRAGRYRDTNSSSRNGYHR